VSRTIEIIDKWLNDAKDDLESNYIRLGLKASGNWAKQLEIFSNETNLGYEIGIKGERYTGAIEYGRNANTNQTPEGLRKFAGWAGSTFIAKWVKDKGLNLNPYAVAYNIGKYGWRVPNVNNAGGLISDVITQDRINDLEKLLIYGKIEEIKTDVINTLQDGSN
jgi:hypothetical protein